MCGSPMDGYKRKGGNSELLFFSRLLGTISSNNICSKGGSTVK